MDAALINRDGTPGKSRLGANALLAASLATAKAAAHAQGRRSIATWRHCMSDRAGKYNRLLHIEEELGDTAQYKTGLAQYKT